VSFVGESMPTPGGLMKNAHHDGSWFPPRAKVLATIGLILAGLVGGSTPARAAESVPDPAVVARLATLLLQVRADRLVAPRATHVSLPAGVATTAVREQEASRARVVLDLRHRIDMANGGYSRAEVSVGVDTVTVNDTGQVTAEIRERTKLYLADPDFGGIPEQYAVSRIMALEPKDGTWVIASERLARAEGLPPVTDGLPAPSPVFPAPQPDRTAADTVRPANIPSPRGKGDPVATVDAQYDYAAIVDYAYQYATDHNGSYRDYANDCTNFVSQAMKAGGWEQEGSGFLSRKNNTKWYYGSRTWTTSYSWAGADNWAKFAQVHSKRTSALANVWYLLPSDVLQADWDTNNNINHSMVVTSRTASGEPRLTYHTSDTVNKPLSTLLAQNPHSWWYAHRT
jgi:hypothetical protein